MQWLDSLKRLSLARAILLMWRSTQGGRASILPVNKLTNYHIINPPWTAAEAACITSTKLFSSRFTVNLSPSQTTLSSCHVSQRWFNNHTLSWISSSPPFVSTGNTRKTFFPGREEQTSASELIPEMVLLSLPAWTGQMNEACFRKLFADGISKDNPNVFILHNPGMPIVAFLYNQRYIAVEHILGHSIYLHRHTWSKSQFMFSDYCFRYSCCWMCHMA